MRKNTWTTSVYVIGSVYILLFVLSDNLTTRPWDRLKLNNVPINRVPAEKAKLFRSIDLPWKHSYMYFLLNCYRVLTFGLFWFLNGFIMRLFCETYTGIQYQSNPIRSCFNFESWQYNSYLRRILIDASGGSATLPEYIRNLANELNSRNCAIQEILITHHHWDHTEGVQQIFKEITKSKLKLKFCLL